MTTNATVNFNIKAPAANRNPACPGNPNPGCQITMAGDSQWVRKYVAIGDSYSAGPGAGDDYDQERLNSRPCYRSKGAYPVHIKDHRDLSPYQF
jgi:hypothetical protein